MSSEVESWALTHALYTFIWNVVVLYFSVDGIYKLNNSANFTLKLNFKKVINLCTRDEMSLQNNLTKLANLVIFNAEIW